MIKDKVVTVMVLGQSLPVRLQPDEHLFVRVLKVSDAKPPEMLVEGPVEAFPVMAPVMEVVKLEEAATGKVIFDATWFRSLANR